MPKRLIYKFKIGAFKPATIPMARLSEYMSDLAGLLGETGSVHFFELEEGSCVLNAAVDVEAIPKVSERIASLEHGEPTDDLQKHFDALDKLLADDNATGSLVAYADNSENGANVVCFPGCERPKPVDYGVIKERGSLDGVPVSIGGRDATKHIQLQDGERIYTGIVVNTELAKQIDDAKCLWRRAIRLHGVGRWKRSPDGEWQLKRFTVENFEVLDDASLKDTLDKMRAVPDSGWSDDEDPIEYLQHLRNDPSETTH